MCIVLLEAYRGFPRHSLLGSARLALGIVDFDRPGQLSDDLRLQTTGFVGKVVTLFRNLSRRGLSAPRDSLVH